VQTSAKLPLEFCWKAYFVLKSLLRVCQTWWRYLKPQQSYCKWKIFSMAVLTLNFGLDLSKVNSDIWHIPLAQLPSNVAVVLGLVHRQNRLDTVDFVAIRQSQPSWTCSILVDFADSVVYVDSTGDKKSKSILSPCIGLDSWRQTLSLAGRGILGLEL